VPGARNGRRVVVARRAREELLSGVDSLARVARLTLGPRGRNVGMVHKDYPGPRIVNRTHLVFDDLEIADPVANVGAKLLREAAARTGETVGDGTTTAVVLTHAMIGAGVRAVAAGANPMLLRRGIERASQSVAAEVRAQARQVASVDEIRRLATAWSSDEGIGAIVAEALERVGENGLISLERSQRGAALELEFSEGMTLPRGYLSPHFLPPGGARAIELDEPYVLLTDREISDASDLVPVLERLARLERRELLLVASDVSGPALALLTANNAAGVVRCVAVRAPEVNELRREILEDLAIWTGGRFVGKDLGDRLHFVTPADLGRARSAHIDGDETAIVGGRGDADRVQRRIAAIKAEASACHDSYRKEKLDRRVARLSGGVAVIWYGGATDAERNDRRLRLEDAVASMWAALRGGLVPGGGVALVNAAARLDQVEAEGDEAAGVAVVRRALEEPLRQIVANAGRHGGVVLANVRRLQREQGNPNVGYDVVGEEYCDLSASGIMDPAEVACAALETAASCAAMLLTTEAVVRVAR
jgi:chaperonin GroEL